MLGELCGHRTLMGRRCGKLLTKDDRRARETLTSSWGMFQVWDLRAIPQFSGENNTSLLERARFFFSWISFAGNGVYMHRRKENPPIQLSHERAFILVTLTRSSQSCMCNVNMLPTKNLWLTCPQLHMGYAPELLSNVCLPFSCTTPDKGKSNNWNASLSPSMDAVTLQIYSKHLLRHTCYNPVQKKKSSFQFSYHENSFLKPNVTLSNPY